jgi:hypothetical protein
MLVEFFRLILAADIAGSTAAWLGLWGSLLSYSPQRRYTPKPPKVLPVNEADNLTRTFVGLPKIQIGNT